MLYDRTGEYLYRYPLCSFKLKVAQACPLLARAGVSRLELVASFRLGRSV